MRYISFISYFAIFLNTGYAIAPYPDGPVNDYTRLLEKTEAEWTATAAAGKTGLSLAGLTLECVRHPDHAFYIGTKVTAVIQASLGAVEKVVDNVAGYNEIFFGFEEIKKSETLADGWTVFWHRAVPVPFIPDLRYEVVYKNSKDNPNRKTYRYQMKEKIDLLKGLDGLIVLEALTPSQTHLTQFLFIDAKYGPMQFFAPAKIWADAIRDVYLANVGIQLRAENPGWPKEKLREEAQKAFKENRANICVGKKVSLAGVAAGGLK